MAYKIIDRVYNAYTDDYRLTIIADTDEDVLDLPLASVGSTVIVADRGNEYIANSKGGWVFKSGDESRAVKYIIGAKEIAGTWQFNDTPDLQTFKGMSWIFNFTIDGTNGVSFGCYDWQDALWYEADYDGDGVPECEETVYGTGNILITSATVDSIINGEALLALLNANATKIS